MYEGIFPLNFHDLVQNNGTDLYSPPTYTPISRYIQTEFYDANVLLIDNRFWEC